MKIGIVTCWQPDDNYGTQIQCFALQTYLRKQGHDAFLIRYCRFEDIKKQTFTLRRFCKVFNPVKLSRFITNRLFYKRHLQETLLHDRDAPAFRKKYLNMTKLYPSYQDLLADPPVADAYIVGSDQVWNIAYYQDNNLNAHFLQFGSQSIKRISYAASFGFGLPALNKAYSDKVKLLLSKFNAISVREDVGIDILNHVGIKNTVKVCDPTLLLSSDDYVTSFAKESFRLPKAKYVLVYELVAKSRLDIKEIKKWAANKNLEVIYITGHGKITKHERLYPTVPEWVLLIKNAEFVITNSFHGTVFSLLFHRQVAVYLLNQAGASETNVRIDTLINLTEQNLVAKQAKDFSNVLETQIDWNIFEKNKNDLRQIGIDFLKVNLGSVE